MATQKDIELAERFVETLSREMAELKKRVEGLSRWFEQVDAEESALRALIAHAKKTVPAEPQPGNPSETPNSSPPFHNPANADDYNTMHDYFGK